MTSKKKAKLRRKFYVKIRTSYYFIKSIPFLLRLAYLRCNCLWWKIETAIYNELSAKIEREIEIERLEHDLIEGVEHVVEHVEKLKV